MSNFPLFLVTLHFDLILPLSFLNRINTCLPSFSLFRRAAVVPELKNRVQQKGTAQTKRGGSGDPEKVWLWDREQFFSKDQLEMKCFLTWSRSKKEKQNRRLYLACRVEAFELRHKLYKVVLYNRNITCPKGIC